MASLAARAFLAQGPRLPANSGASRPGRSRRVTRRSATIRSQYETERIDRGAVTLPSQPKEPLHFLEEHKSGACIRRYDLSGPQLRVEEPGAEGEGGGTGATEGLAGALMPGLRNFFLPAGFPASVSSDYLEYKLWTLPTHVTGWCCGTLVTSSLLRAVGIGVGPEGTAAAAAAIKYVCRWVTKDGAGALGRFVVGGRFGSVFDEDPKRWRMIADIVGSAGGILELATPLWPGHFLLLASMGTFTKSVAKSFKDPSFRVIQNHFAVSENVGDVAAKDQVWAVVAQLTGLGCGVLLLNNEAVASSYQQLVLTWAGLRTLHLWLRWRSLATLCFPTINYKRAVLLIRAHAASAPLSGALGVRECNIAERILLPREWVRPRVHFGCKLHDLVGEGACSAQVMALLEVFAAEDFLLVTKANAAVSLVAFKSTSSPLTTLKSLYLAFLIERSLELQQHQSPNYSMDMVPLSDVAEALARVNVVFEDFLETLASLGWDTTKIVVRPSPESERLVLTSPSNPV